GIRWSWCGTPNADTPVFGKHFYLRARLQTKLHHLSGGMNRATELPISFKRLFLSTSNLFAS
ncbi:MAG: hypothetical protein M3118_05400, partial [Actinomycetota bacterium]|nr:hypothetical protein [Actinomycetota bacterium]